VIARPDYAAVRQTNDYGLMTKDPVHAARSTPHGSRFTPHGPLPTPLFGSFGFRVSDLGFEPVPPYRVSISDFEFKI